MVIPALENDRAKAPSGLADNGKGGDSTSGDQQQKLIKSTGANLDSKTINASGIPINNDAWGQVTTQYPEFYASKDVPKYQIDLTKKWYEIASKAWGNYGPTEFWIVGNSQSEAIKLTDQYCELRIKKAKILAKLIVLMAIVLLIILNMEEQDYLLSETIGITGLDLLLESPQSHLLK